MALPFLQPAEDPRRNLLSDLLGRCANPARPFLRWPGGTLSLEDVARAPANGLEAVRPGDVVALVGGFDASSIALLLRLLDKGAVVAPLTPDTAARHDYYFAAARADVLLQDGKARRLSAAQDRHPLLEQLRERNEGGLILFSSGSTGDPKAILHSSAHFLARYATRRKALRTLAFLLFDHIGGLNTLLHTLYNEGEVVVPPSLAPADVAASLRAEKVELLPASPTFLRLLLLSGELDHGAFPALKLVTYGTERMDQPTLDALCRLLPDTDFRQTYGMSELGILRVSSKARDSLWMRVGGEGVSTKVQGGVLHIRAEHRMLGYLNAPCPFDPEGWLNTGDLVEQDGPWLRITGRISEIINIGGLKIIPAEVEKACLEFPGVVLAKAFGVPNPVTGEHVEVRCQLAPQLAKDPTAARNALRLHLKNLLPAHALPQRIHLGDVPVSYRYKKK